MSSELPPAPSDSLPAWPELTPHERRVLGVLVEKAKTTPDTYPLSVNALLTGCNQKSNRDPAMSLTEAEIDDALSRLQQKGLVIKITGGRVVRWRHNLYETWRLGKVELAIMGELLLRGPQTEGELRSRASRMEEIADLDTLRELLRPLVERRLIIYLTSTGRRGTILTHAFHADSEIHQVQTQHPQDSSPAGGEEETSDALAGQSSDRSRQSPPGRPNPSQEERLAAIEAQLMEARADIDALRQVLAQMQQRLAERASHAVPPPAPSATPMP